MGKQDNSILHSRLLCQAMNNKLALSSTVYVLAYKNWVFK